MLRRRRFMRTRRVGCGGLLIVLLILFAIVFFVSRLPV